MISDLCDFWPAIREIRMKKVINVQSIDNVFCVVSNGRFVMAGRKSHKSEIIVSSLYDSAKS